MKRKTQFQVVKLEEVLKTAIEVNGIATVENNTDPRRPKRQSHPYRKFLENSEAGNTKKRE